MCTGSFDIVASLQMGFPRERAVVGLGPSGLKEIMLMSIKNGQITYIVGLLFIILKNK